jgi:hypothetical protein
MSTIENNDLFNSHNLSAKYGLMAGGIMATILLFFQLLHVDYAPYLKLIKYVALGAIIVTALNTVAKRGTKRVFPAGAYMGVKVSLLAGLVLMVVNMVLFLANPDLAFSKYHVEPSTMMEAAIVSMMLFFETWVIGGIITFITLQYIKGKVNR